MGWFNDAKKAVKKAAKVVTGTTKVLTGASFVEGALKGDISGQLSKDLSNATAGVMSLPVKEVPTTEVPYQDPETLDLYVSGQLQKAKKKSRSATDNTQSSASKTNTLGGISKLGV